MHISVRSGHVYHLPSPSGYKNDLTQRQTKKTSSTIAIHLCSFIHHFTKRKQQKETALNSCTCTDLDAVTPEDQQSMKLI